MATPLFTTATRPKPADAYFDAAEAQKAVQFFLLLRHVKGRWAGKPFVLEPWEEDIVREAFGWFRADGTRLYRTIYLEVPRKNGKSTLAAGIAGKLLFADNEAGAEVVSAAADKDQARIIRAILGGMVKASTPLHKRADVFRNEIVVPSTDSNYKVLSADVAGKWGSNLHGIIFDEVHAQPNRELWDALTTATGSRAQPMIVAITTAGWDQNSLAFELHEHTRQIAEGLMDDPSFLGVIYAAPQDADWTDPEVQKAANPNLGVTITEGFLVDEARRAEQIPTFQNSFRRLYLNQWTQQDVRFVPMRDWDVNTTVPILEQGMAAFGGLDLSSSTDLTAFVLAFPQDDATAILPYFFIPQDGLRERGLRDRVPYETWVRDGHIIATPGNVIDYAIVKRTILEAAELYDIRDVSYDRWGAVQLVQELEAEGLTMVPVGQGFASMSSPSKELLRLVMEKKLHHGGHPVLRFNADSAAAETDAAGNVKPSKAKSTGRIDGIVATVMALDGVMRRGRALKKKSVYEGRGMMKV